MPQQARLFRPVAGASMNRSSSIVYHFVLAFALLFAAPCAPAAEPGRLLSILLLDAKTAKPISRVTILLLFRDSKGATRKLGQLTTSKDGTAALSLPEPLPERIDISYQPDEVKSCTDVEFATREILSVGVVAKNTCDVARSTIEVHPKAGQLVLFATRMTLSERVHHELP